MAYMRPASASLDRRIRTAFSARSFHSLTAADRGATTGPALAGTARPAPISASTTPQTTFFTQDIQTERQANQRRAVDSVYISRTGRSIVVTRRSTSPRHYLP